MIIEEKLTEMGIVLPQPVNVPPGMTVPFGWVRTLGDRAYVSGHGPLERDGTPAGPFGKVGQEVSAEQACGAARLATIAMLASLKRSLGDLDRVRAWLVVSGMVNTASNFTLTTCVMNGSSELLLALYGPIAGMHARTAVGVAQLPLGLPVLVAAEVAIEKRPEKRESAWTAHWRETGSTDSEESQEVRRGV